ncbi:hypothetical protein PAHAL_5G273100 [Panicum hallii]|jgi:hypothetical protein|uniref:Uncharacterized protein n=1 Tax=Panicum hallii TaxID=206008 RepID=A0A2T8ILF8_9POAL|nr:hypothetical protein PAHAL_5G273100 [Panicum hallii]
MESSAPCCFEGSGVAGPIRDGTDLGAGWGAPIYTRASVLQGGHGGGGTRVQVVRCGGRNGRGARAGDDDDRDRGAGRCRASGGGGGPTKPPRPCPPGLARQLPAACEPGFSRPRPGRSKYPYRATGMLGVGWPVEAINRGGNDLKHTVLVAALLTDGQAHTCSTGQFLFLPLGSCLDPETPRASYRVVSD